MPNIAETKRIFESTPIDQAIMLIGIHGIGKSEITKSLMQAMGYHVITFFLGQLSDSGDLVGLPDRTEIELTSPDGKVYRQKITEFCPPKWWPFDPDAKICIIMDEFNRGKPEVYQCIFDMVLNRQMNGLKLPEHTRIVACMNPIGDEWDYDVTELDAALKDRFNVYRFQPTEDEWIDYAMKTKHHPYVIGFIAVNKQYLDPPKKTNNESSGSGILLDGVYPSRRSWTRVSNILKMEANHNIEQDEEFLATLLFGVVGVGAGNMFIKFINESRSKLSGAKIVTGWDNAMQAKVMTVKKQDLIHLNKEIAIYIETEEKALFDDSNRSEAERYAKNVSAYLKVLDGIAPELRGEFIEHVLIAQANNKTWPLKFLRLDQEGLVNISVDVISGNYDYDAFNKNKEHDYKLKDEEDKDEDGFVPPKSPEIPKDPNDPFSNLDVDGFLDSL